MKDFENIGKRLPYVETPEYISSVINKGVEMAIKSEVKRKKNNIIRLCTIATSTVAASIALMFIFTDTFNSDYDKIADSKPLSEVLSELSDDQVMQLTAYSIDDIPEY